MILHTKGPTLRNAPRSDLAIAIRKTVRGSLPKIAFAQIARMILGPRYELSVVICGDALARRMNRVYRKKTYAANVLSFPLGRHEGEIFLNMAAAERESKRFHVSLRARATLLFIHGCLHLKGLRHGASMERIEDAMLKKFG